MREIRVQTVVTVYELDEDRKPIEGQKVKGFKVGNKKLVSDDVPEFGQKLMAETMIMECQNVALNEISGANWA